MKRLSYISLLLLCLLFLNCTSPIVDSFKVIQTSLEKSNEVLKKSNTTKLKEIHALGLGVVSKQADSIYFAAENLNGLIDEFKKQIKNLDLSGLDTHIAYDVIANPDIVKGALMSATSTLVMRNSKVEIDQSKKKRRDSIINNMTQVNSRSIYFTQSFKDVPSAGALVTLAKMQLEGSEITSISLESIQQSLTHANPLYKGGDIKLLMKYFTKEINPLLISCIREPKVENLPTRLKIILNFDSAGIVTDVEFPEKNISDQCKELIKNELMKMQGWTAPTVSGIPIKSKYTWNIACLMWE
jgi:hypothetical protein